MTDLIYNKFDKIFEERLIRRYFKMVLEEIRNHKPIPLDEVRTRRRSTTFRDGFILLNTHTITII